MSTNLPRVVQKIFGANADTDDAIAQFGSVIAGQPYLTGDIEEIQALNAWRNGWVGSTITNKRYPTSEETTGINKVVTQQIAYILQKGLPEWSAEETYYTNSFCQIDGTIYVSLTDNNIGNIPSSSPASWERYQVNNAVTRSVGELVISALPLTEAGLHLMDGELLYGNGIYSDFVQYVAEKYNNSDKYINVNIFGNVSRVDNILSNFAADNYATLPISITLGNNFKIAFQITIGELNASNQSILSSNFDYCLSLGIDTNNSLAFNIGDGTAWLNPTVEVLEFSTNTTYDFELSYSNSRYSLTYSIEGGEPVEVAYLENSTTIPTCLLQLGVSQSFSNAFQGSINLNNSYIDVNNSRRWSGTKVAWTIDEPTWQALVNERGVCGKFVYDPTANTLRLPKITGIIEGTTDINALGDLVEAGMPIMTTDSNGLHTHTRGNQNITAWFNLLGDGGAVAKSGGASGAIYFSTRGSGQVYENTGGQTSTQVTGINFDASRSWTGTTSEEGSHIHTISWGTPTNTIQPQTIKLMFYLVVAVGTKTDLEIDIDQVTDDLGRINQQIIDLSARVDEATNINNLLFDFKWSDRQLNDASWLRADTFSWQSGNVYSAAYSHLVDDLQSNLISETETIGSYTVTFYRATDGHKVCLADQETTVANIYSETGIAWYYILDTTNTQFKLPRTKCGFEGLRTNVGDKIDESLSNINAYLELRSRGYAAGLEGYATGAFRTTPGIQSGNFSSPQGSNGLKDITFDASRSSSTYQDNAPVQERATQMYLYFYVGDYSQTAIEQTAGLNSELFNGKADVNLANTAAKLSDDFLDKMSPDYSSAIALYPSTTSYTCPSDGYFDFNTVVSASSNEFYGLINGQRVVLLQQVNHTNRCAGGAVRVSKGDVASWGGQWSDFQFFFFPLKGAN